MFFVSLLEQDTIRNKRIKKISELNADNNDSNKYKIEAIWNSTIYANELESGHLPGLYYLVVWKGYHEEKNT